MDNDPRWQEMRRSGHLAGRTVHYAVSVTSTNALALEGGRAGAATGTVWVAETQTAGRGRLGKGWQSPPGVGLYATVILRPALALAQLPRLTLAAGLAAARAIDQLSGLTSLIKWPNDVLLAGKKVAGVLAECSLPPGGEPVLALGVGINVSNGAGQFPPEIADRATALGLMSGRRIDRGELLEALLGWIDHEVVRLEQGQFADILADWRAKDALAGKKVTWLTTEGHVVCGTSLGPDPEGMLVIRDEAGHRHHVLSGDLTLSPLLYSR